MATTSLAEFEASLARIQWFSEIGKPTADSMVKRLVSWDEWPGPEEPNVAAVSLKHQEFHDGVLAAHTEKKKELEELFQRIVADVRRSAASALSVPTDGDAWDAPSQATWQAGWTAGLVALYLATNERLPPELEQQWSWFVRGHWPTAIFKATIKSESDVSQVF